jgi:hypothetical protein
MAVDSASPFDINIDPLTIEFDTNINIDIDTASTINVGIAVPAVIDTTPPETEVDIARSTTIDTASPSVADLTPAATTIDPVSSPTGAVSAVTGGFDMAFGLFNFHMDNDRDAELISISDSTPPAADPSASPTIECNPSTTMPLAPSEEEPRLETSTPSVGSNDFQDHRTYVAFGTSRLARGRNQNKIRLDCILLQRGRRLREVLQCGVPNVLLLRVSGLLEGGIVGSKLESITFTQAR